MKVKIYLNIWRELFALLLYALCDQHLQDDIILDAKKITRNKGKFESLCIALLNDPFRNIFYYRTKAIHPVLRNLSKLFLPPVKSVEITGGEYGGGGANCS